VAGGLLAGDDVDPIIDSVSLSLWNDNAIRTADFVVEAAPEILDLKQRLFERCGRLCRPNVVVASNASTLGIAEIAANMASPERAIVTHWFAPAHILMPGRSRGSSKSRRLADCFMMLSRERSFPHCLSTWTTVPARPKP
jgi:hypothetical protein